MVKKLFALASISGLSGLMAMTAASGCSSTTTPAADTPDTSTPTTKEAGTKDTGTGTDEDATPPDTTCPPSGTISAADVDMVFKWMPPKAPQDVCTQKNLDDLKATITKAGATGVPFADIKTSLGATCAACAFSKDTDANWQVYVENTKGTLSNRTASCLAQVEGAACGKAYFQVDICVKSACNTTDCGDDAAVSACQQKVLSKGGACADLDAALIAACPQLDADLADGAICTTSPGSISVTCGGGLDGGLDASL